MTIAQFTHTKIKGISVVIPEKEINIYDEAQYYGNNIKKIERMHKIVGFYKRHVVDEGVTASDLCIQAAETLINEMKIDKKSVDALIFIVQRPDHSAPATAYYIHNLLGLDKNCLAFDIRQGCPGWVYGLFVASSMIDSGAAKKVLLLAGDTPSVGVDLADRNVAPVFGDGGSATLLEFSEDENITNFNITVNSKGYEAIIKPASGYRLPFKFNESDKDLVTPIISSSGTKHRLVDLFMDGLAVFDFTMNWVPQNILDLMKYSKISQENVDYLMLHQANKQIVQTLSHKIGFSEEKAPWASFEQLGNQSITSIPIAIAFNLSDIVSSHKLKLLCSGYGNGLAVASVVMNLDQIYCSGIRYYTVLHSRKTRNDYIKYWQDKLGK